MSALQGATVEVYKSGILVATGETDQNGVYSTALPAGTYDIYISAPNMQTIHRTTTLTGSEELIVNLTIPVPQLLQASPTDMLDRDEGIQISNEPNELMDEYPLIEEGIVINNSPTYIEEDNPPTELTREEGIVINNAPDEPLYESFQRSELLWYNNIVDWAVYEWTILYENMTYLNNPIVDSQSLPNESLVRGEQVLISNSPAPPPPAGTGTTETTNPAYINISEQMMVADCVFADSSPKENLMQTNEAIICFYMTSINERAGYETCLIAESMSYVNH